MIVIVDVKCTLEITSAWPHYNCVVIFS